MAIGRVTRYPRQSLLQFSDVDRSSQGLGVRRSCQHALPPLADKLSGRAGARPHSNLRF
jgi:hypothetical protein